MHFNVDIFPNDITTIYPRLSQLRFLVVIFILLPENCSSVTSIRCAAGITQEHAGNPGRAERRTRRAQEHSCGPILCSSVLRREEKREERREKGEEKTEGRREKREREKERKREEKII